MMFPDLDFIKEYITSEFSNTNNKEAIYRGFKFSYNLASYNNGEFIIRLEKDKIAINLPFSMSQNPSDCLKFVKGLIDFICEQTENSVNKIIEEVKKRKAILDSSVFAPIEQNNDIEEYDDDYNCFSHLTEDLDEEEIPQDKIQKQDVKDSNDLKDWFKSTDTTRYLK